MKVKVLVCFVFFNVIARINAGAFKALLYSDWITCDHNKTLDIDIRQTQIYFYDFQNNYNISHEITGAVDAITSMYNLDVTRKLIFFVPGYKSNIAKKTEELVRQTFSEVKDIYLIVIDHSAYTSAQGGKFKSYERSVFHTYYIGKALGKVLSDFHSKGYPSKNIHAIGHSLGSQMLGYAGEIYKEMTKEKLWRITGIDPAGPCFSNSLIEDQIRSGVAEYVEVYHCNAGGLGTTSVLADIDFFINNGHTEPQCKGGILTLPGKGESDSAKCSHKKCVTYYMKSVAQPSWYLAWRCENYENFKKGRCAGNEVTLAGYHNPGNATGVFYVSTDAYGV